MRQMIISLLTISVVSCSISCSSLPDETISAERGPRAQIKEALGWTVLFDIADLCADIALAIKTSQVDKELKQLKSKVGAIESHLNALENYVVDVSSFAKRSAYLDMLRDIDVQRSYILSAVSIHNDRKALGIPSNADEDMLRIANALTEQRFYFFANPASGPDRFDHRLALGTFLLAANTWFALRESNGKLLTDPVYSDVKKWADHLKWIATMMRSSVSCSHWHSPAGCRVDCDDDSTITNLSPCHRTCWTCTDSYTCSDLIEQKETKTYGTCGTVGPPENPLLQYDPDSLVRMADSWLATALESHKVVFNWVEYLDLNSDLRPAGIVSEGQAFQHWLTSGIKEGRQSSKFFHVRQYLQMYPDLATAFGTNYAQGLNHYAFGGRFEGRAGIYALHPEIFDWKFYVAFAANSDLPAAGVTTQTLAVSHWLSSGLLEGRRAHNSFWSTDYLDLNSDVAAGAGTDAKRYWHAIEHYLLAGRYEGRRAVK